MDPKLTKRFTWIGRCASIAGGYLHHLDQMNSNASRYFFEVRSIHTERKTEAGYFPTVYHLEKPRCYYLGTYPNYWSPRNKQIVFAHELATERDQPMPNTPIVPGLTLSIAEQDALKEIETKYPPEAIKYFVYREQIPADLTQLEREKLNATLYQINKDIRDYLWFHPVKDITTLMAQAMALETRKIRLSQCMTKYYPKPTKTPQKKVETPRGTLEYPGQPMSELTLPTPEIKPHSRPAPPQQLLRLVFSFGIKQISTKDALDLNLWIIALGD